MPMGPLSVAAASPLPYPLPHTAVLKLPFRVSARPDTLIAPLEKALARLPSRAMTLMPVPPFRLMVQLLPSRPTFSAGRNYARPFMSMVPLLSATASGPSTTRMPTAFCTLLPSTMRPSLIMVEL
ncbi:hypothetical protein EIO60_01630|nr:hypothetical protein [Candidatus Pantoea persica]